MRGDLELHMVHEFNGSYAVVGILCEVDNFATSAFFDNLMASYGVSGMIDPTSLLESVDTTKYYSYDGSFTTPPCTEGVKWNVIADTCKLPKDFYEWTQTFHSMQSNYREIEPLNDRTITVMDSHGILIDFIYLLLRLGLEISF